DPALADDDHPGVIVGQVRPRACSQRQRRGWLVAGEPDADERRTEVVDQRLRAGLELVGEVALGGERGADRGGELCLPDALASRADIAGHPVDQWLLPLRGD